MTNGSERSGLVYLDASAVVKLVSPEPETPALMRFLEERPHRVTSIVAAVEVPRAVRRKAAAARRLRRADQVLSRLALVELDEPIRARARTLDPPGLRTLDAIHVATALDLGADLDGVVTYDARQAEAMRRLGMDVYSPGHPEDRLRH